MSIKLIISDENETGQIILTLEEAKSLSKALNELFVDYRDYRVEYTTTTPNFGSIAYSLFDHS